MRDRIAELNFAAGDSIAAQHAVERFTDRTEFKQRLLSDWTVIGDIGFTPGKVIRFPLIDNRNGHARNCLLLHQRCDGAVNDIGNLLFCFCGGKRGERSCQQQRAAYRFFHHEISSVIKSERVSGPVRRNQCV